MKFRTILLGLVALFVAFNAAFFSVIGLSKLFAGASLAVILMASSLEIAKLTSASFLYNYWDKINKYLRMYLIVGVFILITITSAGIYGFLTSAFQSTSDKLMVIDKKSQVIELKRDRFEKQLNSYVVEKRELSTSISELSKGLSNNKIQYVDRETGELITTTSSSTRRVLTNELKDAKSQRNLISVKIESISDSITKLDLQVLDLVTNNEVAGEVGPLKYLSKLTGKSMESIVNWFTMFIIVVFDPLAVTLIIAFNTALKVDKLEDKKEKEEYDLEDPITIEHVESDEFLGSDVEDDRLIEVDTNHDGIITPQEQRNAYNSGGWKNSYQGKQNFYHPWFDWSNPEWWIYDVQATQHWLDVRGGTRGAYDSIKKNYENK